MKQDETHANSDLIALPGIRSHRALLPDRFLPLDELDVSSPHENLRAFGFDGAWIGDDIHALALKAGQGALDAAGLKAEEIGALLCGGALPSAHLRQSEKPGDTGLLGMFCYQASWLQDALGLERAFISGVAQQGCAGMFSALRQARALLMAEPDLEHVLCVGADAFPQGAMREVLYNVVSDAACAVVVSRENLRYRWLAHHQISKGWYWDVPTRQSEIIAAYFPTAAMTVRRVLAKADLKAGDVDLVIPTGVNAASWPILLRLCGIPEDRLFIPRQRFGHTIAADSFLMLEQARATGVLRPGQRVLLFAYGFGSSWSAIILEITDLI
ncbi:3-oxoacyl-[acyl-carrier-protein] synthase III C-terminal domain-containing protein [Prosthecobacter sp. SYSU 5D2]|uniref:3-oxoacyl-[acyl-carrier-protein] synthase III C-terminal domain-containing protein n=1 Tax=Prosthecobacter sp. SYSU 5D2 TaxID=3134134 RepID=UPI0031FE666D